LSLNPIRLTGALREDELIDMSTCFVIQPFDEGRFDKRYEDVYVPAIEAAELEPYRVDRDPAAAIPIEQIENGIRRADACLADISTNNPNVWFELGFAIAAGKPVILLCEFQVDRRFPFDIQHRAIINYKSESARDFENLGAAITARLKAAISKESKIEQLAESTPIADVEGLSQHEMVALATIAENIESPSDSTPTSSIRSDMERVGYTKLAATLALTTLLEKGMIESREEFGNYDNSWTVYWITAKGFGWLIAHQERFVLKRESGQAVSQQQIPKLTDDDVPF